MTWWMYVIVIIWWMAVTAIIFFRQSIRQWLRARRHRSESVSHPDRSCRLCGGTATRLVLERNSPVQAATWRCKNRDLCTAARRMKKLLDSPS